MAISDRITSIEEHIKESYQELEGIGIDTTGVNNNLENIPKLIDGYWETLPKVTGEGTSITLDNTKEGKMKINLKGNTSQEGTPTPETPQDIHVVSGDNSIEVCGKNLARETFDTKFVLAGTGNNRTVVSTDYNSAEIVAVKPNTNYVISGDFSSLADNFIRIGMFDNFPKVDDTSTKYIYGASGLTFTTDTNTKYIMLMNGRIVNTTVDNLQLELGQTPTTYEAYKGTSYPINLGDIELCKIGDYQDSIKKSTGKNLFDKDNVNMIEGYLNYSESTVNTSNSTRTIYIPCKTNTTYTVSKIASSRFVIGTTSTIPANNVALIDKNQNNTATKLTLTTSPTAKYLCVFFYHSTYDTSITIQQILNSIMIEEGNITTPVYEPYGKVWYLNKQTGKVVLNGSENWSKSSSSTNDIFVGNDVLSNNASSTNRASSISNYFTYNQSITIINKFYITDNKKTIAIVFTEHGNTTLEQFITWISTHNTSVYYILETPTYTEITDSTLLSQLNTLAKSYASQTNISQESNDLASILNATALEEM